MKPIFILMAVVLILDTTGPAPAASRHTETLDAVRKYSKLRSEVLSLGWSERLRRLQQMGVNVWQFSKNLLQDSTYSNYWPDAVMLCLLTNDKNQPYLADEMIAFAFREEAAYPQWVISAKTSALNTLASLIQPTLMNDEELKRTLIDKVEQVFDRGDTINPDYWIRRFHLESLRSKPPRERTPDETRLLTEAEGAASACMNLAVYLHNLTADEKYLRWILAHERSGSETFQNELRFMLSRAAKAAWDNGQFNSLDFLKRQGYYLHNAPIP